MKNLSVMKWFLAGFAVTSLIVVLAGLIWSPSIGRAQEGAEEEPNNLAWASGDAAGTSQQTDDPEGRQRIPLASEGALAPNDALQGQASGSPTGRTDDPEGRSLIPLSEAAPLPADNLESMADPEGLFDLAVSQANVLREAGLNSNAPQQYTSPLVIPAADFAADGFAPDTMFFSFGGGYVQGDAGAYGCVMAPAYLPQGVTVTDMFVSVYDNDGTNNITVDLRRVDNFSGTQAAMATASTTGNFAGVQTVSDASIVNPLIAYPDFSYYVTTCLFSGNTRLYSVRLYYAVP